MERSDFIQRGEIKVDFLKYYRLVSRWAIQNTDLKVADLELLFYLDPIVYFTIDKSHESSGRKGDQQIQSKSQRKASYK